MKAIVWTVTSDTKYGTACDVFLSEEAALDHIFEHAVREHADDVHLEALRAEFDDDPYEVVERLKPWGDQWSHESHAIDLPVTKLIKDTFHSFRRQFRLWRRMRTRLA